MKRILCLHMPNLPTDRLMNAAGRQPDKRSDAAGLVIVSPSSGGLRVVRADLAARRRGVRIGCTLAEACAIAPGVAFESLDEAGDRAAIEALARWAVCLSPIVHIEDADSLFVDVTGCQRLFGQDQRLIERAAKGVAGQGFTVWASIADTAGAAWALAHAGESDRIVSPPGAAAASIARLPVASLRVEASTVQALRRVGVTTVEALLHLPRSSLAARFGDAVLRRLDQALGDAPEMLTAYQPPPPVRVRARLAAATDRIEVLRGMLDRLLEAFGKRLARRSAGVRQIRVTLHLAEAGHECLDLSLSRATRSADHLRRLLGARVDALRLSAKVEALCIESCHVETLDHAQQVWFESGETEAAALGDLLDRLAARLGRRTVLRVHPVDEHQPELAYRYVSVLDGIKPPAESAAPGRLRPLRLLPRPAPASVVAIVPDGPPVRFRWRGGEVIAAWCDGPQRLETGWWRGPVVRRDYFHVESDTGCHFWLFRDQCRGDWFVHGLFD